MVANSFGATSQEQCSFPASSLVGSYSSTSCINTSLRVWPATFTTGLLCPIVYIPVAKTPKSSFSPRDGDASCLVSRLHHKEASISKNKNRKLLWGPSTAKLERIINANWRCGQIDKRVAALTLLNLWSAGNPPRVLVCLKMGHNSWACTRPFLLFGGTAFVNNHKEPPSKRDLMTRFACSSASSLADLTAFRALGSQSRNRSRDVEHPRTETAANSVLA